MRIAGCRRMLVSALPLLIAPFAGADDSARLERLLGDMASFQAEFEQVTMNRFGDVMQTVAGRMRLQRPGRLRWEVDEPYPQLVLADGELLWVFDPDLDQVTVQPLAEAIEGWPAAFLTGIDADLARQFEVRALQGAADVGARFVLEPRHPGSVFREATLTFTAAGRLAELAIADHLEQTTRIAFAAAERNPAQAPTLFEFEVPPGVDVIGEIPTEAGKGMPVGKREEMPAGKEEAPPDKEDGPGESASE